MEELILVGLFTDENYGRDVVQHVEPEYFEKAKNRIVFEKTKTYYTKFDRLPSQTEIRVEIDEMHGSISDEIVEESLKAVDSLKLDDRQDPKWLPEETEAFAKDRAFKLALGKCLSVVNGEDKKTSKEALPQVMMDALSVTFDNKIGHDYFDDAGARWDHFHNEQERIPFGISQFNEATGGGLPKKTLTIPVAGTNVGKSAFLCDFAAHLLSIGKNVLYVTLEMSEEETVNRIDANLMKIPLKDLGEVSRDDFLGKVGDFRRRTSGNLVVREYPNKSASVVHFRKLVRDLAVTKKFKPDIILVDYLNICASVNVRPDAGLFQYAKSVAEELRGLAQELDLPIVAPTQTNRGGQSSSDVQLEDVGESHGTSQTADFIFAMIRTENLRENNRILIKQLKNRFGNVDNHGRFLIGVDIDIMSLYEVDDDGNDSHKYGGREALANADDHSEGPIFDSTAAGVGLGVEFGGVNF